jgi:hypothetical protein
MGGLSDKTVRRIEREGRIPTPSERDLLEKFLKIPRTVSDGILNDDANWHPIAAIPLMAEHHPLPAPEPQAVRSNRQNHALEVFRYYRDNRHRLTQLARAYYEGYAHSDFPVVTKAEWLPDHPIPLRKIDQRLQSEWISDEPDPAPPLISALAGETYAQFMARVAPNVRQKDNFCYRLIDAEPLDNDFKLVFCASSYSHFVNSCDVLGYELADWALRSQTGDESIIPWPDGTDLVARGRPEAIFNLRNRSACPATSAVLLLRNTPKGDVFFLHERTSPQLLDSPGGFHVVPSGQFQPDTAEDTNHIRNFSITRTVIRELAEELLGVKEVEEAIRTYDDFYDDPRVAPFVAGLESGAVKLYFMGMGFDALPAKPGFYIALVIDAAHIPSPSLKFIDNWEGKFLAAPMDELEKWSRDSRMIPDGATCLRLALRHLERLVPGTSL